MAVESVIEGKDVWGGAGDPVPSLIKALGPDMVIVGAEVERYCRDWHGDVTTGAVAVVRPRTTEEVSVAVRTIRSLGLAIVPQGGNTGDRKSVV